MNAFYYSVNSDGSKDIHKDNHGGDFTVELYDTMDLHGNWEVALIKMSYFGQRFANVPEEYGKIHLISSAKDLYNKQFILHFYELDDIFINVMMFSELTQQLCHIHCIQFNTIRKHCSFLDSMRIVHVKKYHHNEDNKSFNVNFKVTDSRF